MIVAKFGGTSVGSAENIQKVKEIVRNYPASGRVVVVSAFSQVTNKLELVASRAADSDDGYMTIFTEIEKLHLDRIYELISAPYQTQVMADCKRILNELEDLLNGVFLLKELSARTMDLIYSSGERLSATIITHFFLQEGLSAHYVDARKLIRTDRNFGQARVDKQLSYQQVGTAIASEEDVFVVTGFIGSSDRGETTTLGRGGSDYTASLFAAALQASKLDIWTDVSGVYTANPSSVKSAFPLKALSYQEAMEMSHFGAKVIYPPTIQPLVEKGIPVWIKNTFAPAHEGTLISNEIVDEDLPVKGISSIEQVALITLQGSGLIGVPGIASRLFGTLSDAGINVILITQASSEHSITFAVAPDSADYAVEVMHSEFELEIMTSKVEKPYAEKELSIMAIIGENMRRTTGISGKLFNALGHNGVNVVAIAQGSSERNLSVVVRRRDLEKALNLVHEAFFLSESKTLHLYLIGVGLIGKTLLLQMQQQQEVLLKHQKLRLRLTGLINTRKMWFDEEISFATAVDELLQKGEEAVLPAFISKLREQNKPNSVVIDCTSSTEVVAHYQNLLRHNISIVTPSKLANSGPFEQYKKLHTTAKKYGSRLMFETNVGAGLPVIRTLEDLKLSGDSILRIEGVLSGTLSFLFNQFDGSMPFSELVRDARAKGFTEPDPRDDLNGVDVARKILILSRESGLEMEQDEVDVQNIVPEPLRDRAIAIDEFLDRLAEYDDHFNDLASKAKSEGKKLCYIATLDKGKARTGLEMIGTDHPLYPLSGSDNMLSFTTERYHDRPLVIKGPGAGADVTAAGVFAEIISLQHYFA